MLVDRRNNYSSPFPVALSSGAIVEVPWVFLEARRGGITEEGVVLPAYAPELPLGGDARLNYNRTLARPTHIYAAPSGLESTSLVLATGLGEWTVYKCYLTLSINKYT